MVLQKIGESNTAIDVNGANEGNFTQDDDSTYNVSFDTFANVDNFYRVNINTTLNPNGDNDRIYVLGGGFSHPEYSVSGYVECIDSEDEFENYPVYYNGDSTTVDTELSEGDSVSWTDSGTAGVTFYVEDPSFYDPVFEVDFSMEYTNISASSGYNNVDVTKS